MPDKPAPWKTLENPENVFVKSGAKPVFHDPSRVIEKDLIANWKACYKAQSFVDPDTNELQGQFPFEILLVPKPWKKNEYEEALAHQRRKHGYVKIDEDSMDVDQPNTSEDGNSGEDGGKRKKGVSHAKRGRSSKVKSKATVDTTEDKSKEDLPRKKVKPTHVVRAAAASTSSRHL